MTKENKKKNNYHEIAIVSKRTGGVLRILFKKMIC